MAAFWKEDWDVAKTRLVDWWNHKGLALCVVAPKVEPWADIEEPPTPDGWEARWTDPFYRTQGGIYHLSRCYFGGEAFPYLDTQIGPGSLGLFLGCEPGFASDTVWYEPCIEDPDRHPPLRFDPSNRWFQAHLALAQSGMAAADGRFLVGMPDVIENLDTLCQLRDPQTTMEDMIERPEWVLARIEEINQAFFESFDAIYNTISPEGDGNAFAAFRIWGPGKTAKVQCDALAMISPQMCREFVAPALTEQCRWLDYSMFHLDGTQCIPHLDVLLEIEDLDAIEWTPQTSIEQGGHPRWYDLYRRIKAAGKSVQAINVEPNEVLPLLDAVGHEGMFVMTYTETEAEARELVRRVRGD